ncbi:MAG: hypothetical protein ACR2O7_05160 [Parasphingorhabdus sp.]
MNISDVEAEIKARLPLSMREESVVAEIMDFVDQFGTSEYDRGYSNGEDEADVDVGNYYDIPHSDLDDSPEEIRILARAIRMGDRDEAEYQLDRLVSGASEAQHQVQLGRFDREARIAYAASANVLKVAA